MKRTIPSDHITVFRCGADSKSGWMISCKICGCSVTAYGHPIRDGYVTWFRGRHFECLPRTSRISAIDDLWLANALSKIRKPKRR